MTAKKTRDAISLCILRIPIAPRDNYFRIRCPTLAPFLCTPQLLAALSPAASTWRSFYCLLGRYMSAGTVSAVHAATSSAQSTSVSTTRATQETGKLQRHTRACGTRARGERTSKSNPPAALNQGCALTVGAPPEPSGAIDPSRFDGSVSSNPRTKWHSSAGKVGGRCMLPALDCTMFE